jgi:Mg2+/Co2+ transporter CorC
LDTDSLSPGLVFLAFLVAFSGLSLLQNSATHSSVPDRDARTPLFLRPITLYWLKAACLFAVALSGLALVRAAATSEWWAISLMAAGLLAALFLLDRAVAAYTGRRSQSGWPAARAPGLSGTATNGDGSHPADGSSGLVPSAPETPAITEEELTSLDQRDRAMLRSIIRLDVTTVREVMVPRLDMVAVEADTPLSEVVETIVGRGHSRLPVYEETIDKILGIVYARDVLAALAWPEPGNTLRNLARPAFIVPETKRVDELLEEFQERHIQIAVVVDEYGGTDGLVTMEDVLEEIVGEIEDEFSRNREAHVIWQTDGTVLVDAGVTTDQIAEIFGAGIDSDDFDTVGGFVYHSLGRVPQAGDSVETDELHIEVASILGRRLRRLRIRRVDPTPASTKG